MGLKVCEVLDKRYSEACALCAEKHFKIYGEESSGCAFRNIDGEYCGDIETAEKLRQKRERINDHMDEYLSRLSADNGSAYGFIQNHLKEFTREELGAIIRAFDYMINPGMRKEFSSTDIYEGVCKCVRNELIRGHSENNPR